MLIAELIEAGFVVNSKGIVETKLGRSSYLVEVGDTRRTAAFETDYENSLRHYADMFDEGRYSLMLYDGALVSVKYIMEHDAITWHRYSYVPPVVSLDVGNGEGLGELPPAADYLRTPRRTMLRFEYDPASFAPRHPYSHLHLNGADCRMPVSGSLGLKDFLFFLIDCFYPAFIEPLAALKPSANSSSHISVDDTKRSYIKVPL